MLDNEKNYKYILINPIDERETLGNVTEERSNLIKQFTNASFIYIPVSVKEWNNELSPWKAAPVFGSEGFAGGAVTTLRCILEKYVEPHMKEPDTKIILGGYSLAGLFSLWSGYECDAFYGIAAASPSVWYPDWMEYIEKNTMKAEKVYLSLGDKEEKTRNNVMARVGECIKTQYDRMVLEGKKVTLEWNKGNHFTEADIRLSKAFAWCMELEK